MMAWSAYGSAADLSVHFLTERGIPVLGHVGLMPQPVNVSGGYRARGRAAAEAKRILEDARAMADAGAFAIVVEGTVESLARDITAAVPIPTIGIGASPACDGQILVTDDLIGMFTEFTPRFVKRYAEIAPQRSEERRVGKECVSTGRSRWSPYTQKKQIHSKI